MIVLESSQAATRQCELLNPTQCHCTCLRGPLGWSSICGEGTQRGSSQRQKRGKHSLSKLALQCRHFKRSTISFSLCHTKWTQIVVASHCSRIISCKALVIPLTQWTVFSLALFILLGDIPQLSVWNAACGLTLCLAIGL